MSNNKPLTGKVALVTGATRGIGKGIALQLGQAGALVYITGRTIKSTNGLGSLEETANEIRNRGGKCIPCQVDHENDLEINMLFKKIETEQNGRLDILVNNAYKGVQVIFDNIGIKFWETKPEIWDDINNVGLRNHYICTVYAARLMVPRKQGLIINISSFGGVRYLFNVAYGVGKAACDRMAVDCGKELKSSGVVMLSFYPGAVKTELVMSMNSAKGDDTKEVDFGGAKVDSSKVFAQGESIEFSGKIIVAMAQDPAIMKYAGRVVIGADYAQQHGIRDIDNRVILSVRQVKALCEFMLPERLSFVAKFVPGFIKIPQFILDIMNSKF